MKKISLFLCIALNYTLSDNFIINSHSIKDFELLLKPNQTLIINHQTKALIGILETRADGSMRRLPIPQEWYDKNEDNASRLKTYSDYTTSKTTIGSSTTTIYQKNKDFPSSLQERNKQKQDNMQSPKSTHHTQSPIKPTPSQNIESNISLPTAHPQLIKTPANREWDKKKILYEQKSEYIELER